jgi:2-phospho-L-lactate transferase/gluconeogenesis factor (CofD/UPF0052 family)
VGGIAEAVRSTSAQRVYVCNLWPQQPETAGYDVAAHVEVLARHGVPVDVVICDTSQGLPRGNVAVRVLDIPLTGSNVRVHSPDKLAQALASLLA